MANNPEQLGQYQGGVINIFMNGNAVVNKGLEVEPNGDVTVGKDLTVDGEIKGGVSIVDVSDKFVVTDSDFTNANIQVYKIGKLVFGHISGIYGIPYAKDFMEITDASIRPKSTQYVNALDTEGQTNLAVQFLANGTIQMYDVSPSEGGLLNFTVCYVTN